MKQVSLQSASNLFKTLYGKISQNHYNSATVLLGRVKKSYEFTGDSEFIPVPTTFIGGVGSGSLPKANAMNPEKMLITRKKLYARAKIQREAIKASDEKGAFVKQTKHTVEKTVESFTRNLNRIMLNDGTGSLGVIASEATVGAVTTAVITAASWKAANFEIRDYVNIDSSSALLEVTDVNDATRTVELTLIDGSLPVITDNASVIYMQGSKDNDPQGLKGVCDATSGSLYNIPVGRRWQASQKNALAAALTVDILNEVCLDIQRVSGKSPKMILTGFVQFRKFLALQEDVKRVTLDARYAKLSFKGVEHMTSDGPIPVMVDRFVEDDRIYLLNDDFIEIKHAPDFGWFDDDGTVFMREQDSDSYEARYGGYLEVVIHPTFQGVITNLAI